MAAHGFVRHFEVGELVVASDMPVEGLYIVLSGHFAIYVDRGDGRHKVMEWRGGDVSGLLPYSRMKSSPGDVVAEEPTGRADGSEGAPPRADPAVSADHRDPGARDGGSRAPLHLQRSARREDEVARQAGGGAGPRAQQPGLGGGPQREVAAWRGWSRPRRRRGSWAPRSSRPSSAPRWTRCATHAWRRACPGPRSTLEAADRVDAISDWLEAHGADVAVAGPLADTAVTLPALDRLAEALRGEALDAALRWVAHGCAARFLALEIETAASRIYELVAAVKGFTHMDRETVAQSVDVGKGLADTVTVLRAKVKAKSASVSVVVDPDLPPVLAYGGELNQVWVNLIDNALDAVDRGRPRGGEREARRREDRGADRRRRARHSRCRAPAHLRPVLHDKAPRRGDGTGARHRAQAGESPQRRHRGGIAPGAHRLHGEPASQAGNAGGFLIRVAGAAADRIPGPTVAAGPIPEPAARFLAAVESPAAPSGTCLSWRRGSCRTALPRRLAAPLCLPSFPA